MLALRWRRAGETILAGALALLAIASALAAVRTGGSPARSWAALAAELLGIAMLAFRRSRPLPVLFAVTACAVLAAATADRTIIGPLLPAIGLYAVGTVRSWRATACAAIVVVAAYGGATAFTHNLAAFTAAVLTCAVSSTIGLYVGEHRRLAERVAAEHRLEAAQAVMAERVWLARELHDAIGHHVSLLVVQAGAVQTTLPADHPGRPILAAMIDGGREAMTEMRRLVDVLRPVDSAYDSAAGAGGDRTPAPGLAELTTLCDRLQASGLPVQIRVDVSEAPGRAAEMTAYRIVQEALTNVVKHAGQVPTHVTVVRTGDVLDLRVTNAAAAKTAVDLGSGGNGLASIRRRVAMFDGEVFAGPVPGGGYALRATLRLRERP